MASDRVDIDGMRGYSTPEEAALAGWPQVAEPFVVETSPDGPPGGGPPYEEKWVQVLIDTVPSHPYYVTCFLRDGLWYAAGGHN